MTPLPLRPLFPFHGPLSGSRSARIMPNPAVRLSVGLHAIRKGPNFVRHSPPLGIAATVVGRDSRHAGGLRIGSDELPNR